MVFDYTYISAFGFLFFEPMIALINALFIIFSIIFFRDIIRFKHSYAKHMAWFILSLGISSFFGAIGHTVHYQLGKNFFDFILFLMNAFSLLGVYFLFRASYTFYEPEKGESPLFLKAVLIWITVVLFYSWIKSDFTLIKIHAGVVLLYTLIVHFLDYKESKERGNELLILGLLISFVPIIIHSLHVSIHEWFNHKDLAHVFMILSLIVIYRGLRLNVSNLDTVPVE